MNNVTPFKNFAIFNPQRETLLNTLQDSVDLDLITEAIQEKKAAKNHAHSIHIIFFESKLVGALALSFSEETSMHQLQKTLKQLACLLIDPSFERAINVLKWIEQIQKKHPEKFDWIGIYYKESYLLGTNTTDLILGPFLGEPTDHIRIGIDRGFCGMALREEKIVNVADVTKDSTHIACSLRTRSELVIPLKNSADQFVAELDIDSNQLAAFSPEIELEMQNAAKEFPTIISDSTS